MSRIWKFFGSGSKILEQGRLRQLKMWLQPPLPSTRAPNLEYPRAPKIRLWMVHCICTCNTQIWHFVVVTLLPTGRSRVSKKFSSRSKLKTSWPLLVYAITDIHCRFSSNVINCCATCFAGWATLILATKLLYT